MDRVITDDTDARRARRPRPRPRARVLVGPHRPRARVVLPARIAETADAVRVAVHAGQLLQPVPGGIGRYEIALLRQPPRARRRARSRSRPAPRPRGVGPPRAVDRPRPAARQRALRAVAPAAATRSCGSTPTSCTRRASRSRPSATGRSSSRCTTSRSCACPHVDDAARRQLPHARPRARAPPRRRSSIVPSAFTGRELEREGFDARPHRGRAVRRRPARAARSRRDRPRRRARRRRSRRTCSPSAPSSPARTSPRSCARSSGSAARGPTSRWWSRARAAGARCAASTGRSYASSARSRGHVLDALYRRADAFCLASLYEGFGLPAVEAMARGVPTIATTGSALEEVVQGAGALFAPGDVDACAEQIERVLDDARLRSRARPRRPRPRRRAQLGPVRRGSPPRLRPSPRARAAS